MSKVVFLKLIPQSFDLTNVEFFTEELLDSRTRGKTALVISRTPDDLLTIQGYTPVPFKEKHQCWSLFRVST